jgi:hypothetical protein
MMATRRAAARPWLAAEADSALQEQAASAAAVLRLPLCYSPSRAGPQVHPHLG